jgi:tRNA (guanine26-N2/guanine27-N2)-dimethyltransferase
LGCGFQGVAEQASQELESAFSPSVRDERGRWQVTIQDANKVLLDCYMRKNYFDLIDVDSFGSDSIFLGSALSAVAYGGLIYATSTDGFSSGGHRPYK